WNERNINIVDHDCATHVESLDITLVPICCNVKNIRLMKFAEKENQKKRVVSMVIKGKAVQAKSTKFKPIPVETNKQKGLVF
ncbi:11235_t:CDS:2, partial [Gigaspora rosea]